MCARGSDVLADVKKCVSATATVIVQDVYMCSLIVAPQHSYQEFHGCKYKTDVFTRGLERSCWLFKIVKDEN